MPLTKFSRKFKDTIDPSKHESRNCHLEIVPLGLGESRSKHGVETEKEVYLKRFGAHTIAKFLASMLVTELFPARDAKCLIRYSSVLENKRGRCSAPKSKRCCSAQNKPHFMLVVVIATVPEYEVDKTFPMAPRCSTKPCKAQPQPLAAPIVPPCQGTDPIH